MDPEEIDFGEIEPHGYSYMVILLAFLITMKKWLQFFILISRLVTQVRTQAFQMTRNFHLTALICGSTFISCSE